MKKLNFALIISLLVVLFGACAGGNSKEAKETKVSHKVNSGGLQLVKNNCYACHNPNTKSHDDIIAPPLIAVKKRYKKAYPSKDEFIREMSNWIEHPEEEMAVMMGAVAQFNVMPQLSISSEDAKEIAIYIFENEMEKPQWFEEHEKEMHGEGNGQGQGNKWKESITLKDGNKWKSDAATLRHILSLQKIGKSTKSLGKVEDYHKLSTQFSKEISNLLNDCTMEGPDHNALHKYLMPMMKKNKMLGKVENVKKGERILNKIQTQLNEYQDYFQK